MSKNLDAGMVLAMSAWYDAERYANGRPAQGTQTGMSWLDGLNDWTKIIKAGPCDTDTTDAGGPYQATFSNIRFGDIGSTLPSGPPSGCPGGSLSACMGLCPSSPPAAYKACVANCVKLCPAQL